jgi:hypothetical protein
VCYAPDETEARRTALRWWPNGALAPEALTELAQPRDFEALAELVDEADVAKTVVCGPDPQRHLDAIRRYVGAGFDTVYVHQVGPAQREFIDFYREKVLPAL